MFTRRALLAMIASTPFLGRAAFAASPEVFAESDVAIRGADPVAYFTHGAPRIGSPEHMIMWRGTTWHFESAENRAMFESDPSKYAPQFGGYCAYAMSKGYIASTVPEAWTIHEGKLYLNYSTNVRQIWTQDIPGNITKAQAHWPTILET